MSPLVFLKVPGGKFIFPYFSVDFPGLLYVCSSHHLVLSSISVGVILLLLFCVSRLSMLLSSTSSSSPHTVSSASSVQQGLHSPPPWKSMNQRLSATKLPDMWRRSMTKPGIRTSLFPPSVLSDVLAHNSLMFETSRSYWTLRNPVHCSDTPACFRLRPSSVFFVNHFTQSLQAESWFWSPPPWHCGIYLFIFILARWRSPLTKK